MSAQALSTLKLPALRRLSSLVGLNVSGTKAALISELTSLPASPRRPITRVLSIDMGIRNLAYCVLDLSPTPKIVTWTRTTVPLPDRISLPAFAASAHTLAIDLLRTWKPEQVLIERQRWRSGGGSGVQEWTIKVNTIEAMLHATFHCVRAAGDWDGAFESVDPKRVARLWVPEREGHTSAAQAKKLKKEVVREWLREGGVVELGDEAVAQTAELVAIADMKWPVRADGTRVAAEEKKVDDLADCLLQAMAWRRWTENRRLLRDGRLLSDMEDISAVGCVMRNVTCSPDLERQW
jgi:cruciform cutting endonuclease 1